MLVWRLKSWLKNNLSLNNFSKVSKAKATMNLVAFFMLDFKSVELIL